MYTVAPVSPNVFIEQLGATSLMAHWVRPPIHLNEEHGYRVTYSGGSSGSIHIPNRFADNHLFTGLRNGANYTVTVITTSTDSNTLPSPVATSNLLQMGLQIHTYVYEYCLVLAVLLLAMLIIMHIVTQIPYHKPLLYTRGLVTNTGRGG